LTSVDLPEPEGAEMMKTSPRPWFDALRTTGSPFEFDRSAIFKLLHQKRGTIRF
jgi:hypothetical protein